MAAPAIDGAILAAMHRNDVDALRALAPCMCCCWEHTFGEGCPAYAWGGCRGYGSPHAASVRRSWQEHYAKHHGMDAETFYNRQERSH